MYWEVRILARYDMEYNVEFFERSYKKMRVMSNIAQWLPRVFQTTSLPTYLFMFVNV